MSNRTRVRRPAAFTPSGAARPICPVCWSAPQVVRAQRKRGWRVQGSDGEGHTTAVYPCSNPACDTAIEVRTSLTGGYDASATLENTLRDAEAARFAAGRTTRDGVWRDAAGDPRTAPMQRDLFTT
jgi:hypothetical protein